MHADTPDGGETAFPATTDENWADISLKPEGLSPDCAEGHVAVKPEIGTALLFYSMAPGAERDESLRTVDKFSLHTGCPPEEGQLKWTATVWMHFEPFRPEGFSKEFPKPDMPDPAICEDMEPRCKMWAGAFHTSPVSTGCECAADAVLEMSQVPPSSARRAPAGASACLGRVARLFAGDRSSTGAGVCEHQSPGGLSWSRVVFSPHTHTQPR